MTFPNPALPTPPVFFPRRPFRDGSVKILPFTDRETQEYLEDSTDLDDTISLWDNRSGIPGLLNASLIVRLARRRLAEVYFDFEEGRYRYLVSNRRVPVNRVRLGNLRVAKAQEQVMRDLTIQLRNGEISQQQWYTEMRKAMKDQYRASYIASIGGVDNYTRSEVSKFGWRVRPQYRWLDNFLLEIQSGKQPLNAFAIHRAAMYARAGNGIYQNSLFLIAEQNGKREAARVLGETEKHCHDSATRKGCVELAQTGTYDPRSGLYFVPMWQAVPIGSATCLSHCLCQWRFR